ncbi:hypothetical protein AB3N04_00070 (plasmid) [Alkalihalophilus sp. As8PL]|uniref:Apea-like HEPN domain-containing protein n=1 Tax=Alkalihalophilus sp. As8PL TaxID=3237103 RepID=A0AB39BNW5_9BACI
MKNLQERRFYLNKYKYSINFKNNRITKMFKCIYQFSIVLPFHLPFPPKGFISFPQEDNDVISTGFFDINMKEEVQSGTYREAESLTLNSSLSRVEFAYFTNDVISLDEEAMTKLFNKCINHLNNVILSYKVKYQDSDVFMVTKEMVKNPTILFRQVINLSTWEYADFLFILHSTVPFKKNHLSMDEYLNLSSFIRVIERNDNPFVFVEEMKLESIRKRNYGEYREAILFESICSETFFINLYKVLQSEKGVPSHKIEKNLKYPSYTGIKTLFNSYLPPLLEGNWDYKNVSTEIGAWHEKAYKMRNKVVHNGYFPTYTEVNESIEANTDLRSYVLSLIKDKKIEYPHTNSLYNQ